MMPDKIRNPRRPKRAQKVLMSKAGLDPQQWLVAHKNSTYLYLVEKHFERRKQCIIDMEGNIVKSPGANQANQDKRKYTKPIVRQKARKCK